MASFSAWRSCATVVLFNKGGAATPQNISVRFDELRWGGVQALASDRRCQVRRVWDGGIEGILSGGLTKAVEGGSAFFAVVSGCEE